MGDPRIQEGLELFAEGDLAGAARCWLEALKDGSQERYLREYIDHLRSVQPETVNCEPFSEGASSGATTVVMLQPTSESPLAVPLPLPVQDELAPREPDLAYCESESESESEGKHVPTEDLGGLLAKLDTALAESDFKQAYALGEQALNVAPDDLQARRGSRRAGVGLERECVTRLGDLRRRPRLLVSPRNISDLELDQQRAFVLGQVDGQSSLEEIVEICGMKRLDALRILCELVDRRMVDDQPDDQEEP